MKTAATGLIMLLSLSSTCWSRIGETRDEAIKRYGAPQAKQHSEPADEELFFNFDGWTIWVTLFRGRSVQEWYRKTTAPPAGGRGLRGELSEASVDLCLAANSAGREWKPVQKVRVQREMREVGSSEHLERLLKVWSLDDGSRFAAYLRAVQGTWDSPEGYVDTVIILSREWDDYLKTLEDKQRNEALKKSGL
jgi:hypothetical protein